MRFLKEYAFWNLIFYLDNNDEQHNHNDVGSFILSTERYGQVLCDIGGGRYTSYTWNWEKE